MADCAGSVPHLGGRLVLWHAHRVPGEELVEGRWRQQSMEDTLIRCRRVLGDNHASTLRLAHHLAADLRALGEYQRARQLDAQRRPDDGPDGRAA